MTPTFYRGAAAFGRVPFGGIFPLVVGIALVALVVFLFIRNSKLKKMAVATGCVAASTNIAASNNVNQAESILKERLAKGEINEDEYDKLLLKLKE